MSRSLIYTRENARLILEGAIDECEKGLSEVGFNALVNDGRYNLALRFYKWGKTYEFYWNGGVFEVSEAAYQMAVRCARKRGVPVFLVDKTYERFEGEF